MRREVLGKQACRKGVLITPRSPSQLGNVCGKWVLSTWRTESWPEAATETCRPPEARVGIRAFGAAKRAPGKAGRPCCRLRTQRRCREAGPGAYVSDSPRFLGCQVSKSPRTCMSSQRCSQPRVVHGCPLLSSFSHIPRLVHQQKFSQWSLKNLNSPLCCLPPKLLQMLPSLSSLLWPPRLLPQQPE